MDPERSDSSIGQHVEPESEAVEPQIEASEEAIRNEIAEFRQKYGEGWGMEYFNNFHLHLPIYDEEVDPRTMSQEMGKWKITHRAAGKADKQGERHSELYLDKTPELFHGDIDKALEENGVNSDELRKLFQERRMDELYEHVIPAYVTLRKQGYNRYPDLTV